MPMATGYWTKPLFLSQGHGGEAIILLAWGTLELHQAAKVTKDPVPTLRWGLTCAGDAAWRL